MLPLMNVGSAMAQAVRVQTLSVAEARSETGYTDIRGVHELSDGRVIVLDRLEETVQVLDRQLDNPRQIGREGEGPGEYRRPSRLLALPGDTTVILGGSSRVLVTPDLQTVDYLDARDATAGSVIHLFIAGGARADGQGRLYVQGPTMRTAIEPDPQASDPAPILRLDESAGKVDTLLLFPVPRTRQRLPGPVTAYVASPRVPFETGSTWQLARDGWIAFVFPDPFRVEFYAPDGTPRASAGIPYEPIRVTDAHKQQWLNRPRKGGFSRLLVRDDPANSGWVRNPPTPVREPDEWPAVLPPYLSDGFMGFAPDGSLWIRRTTAADEPPTFDVINRTGRVVERVQLPPGRRLIAFGNGVVYAVARDEMDLEYVERYRLSPSGDGAPE